MDYLAPGTHCVIIEGCPENLGLIVAVIQRLGPVDDYQDAYYVQTVSGRHFHQLWDGVELKRGTSDKCVTERYKLRPLVDPGTEITEHDAVPVTA